MKEGKYTVDDLSPCGYYVLVELEPFEEKSAGGIVLPNQVVNREQAAMTIGKIEKFGPVAFQNSRVDGPDQWGVAIGDKVQFPSHAYMRAPGKGHNLVYVLDYDIKAKVNV